VTGSGPVVAESSPLIALERVGLLFLVRDLFGRIAVPVAVAREVFGEDQPPPWVTVVPLANGPPALPTNLGAGEREAIALAIQLNAGAVVLDDLPARRLAASRGLHVMGTVALLLTAKRAGRIDALAPVLEQLLAAGVRLAQSVQAAALQAADES
jgi:uncharacterized protein